MNGKTSEFLPYESLEVTKFKVWLEQKLSELDKISNEKGYSEETRVDYRPTIYIDITIPGADTSEKERRIANIMAEAKKVFAEQFHLEYQIVIKSL